MWKSVVFVPSAPALVPALSGPGADDVDEVRAAARDALRAAAHPAAGGSPRWIVCGSSLGGQPDSDLTGSGTFAAFGVDLRVSLTGAADDGVADRRWPTSMLMAGWYRETAELGPLGSFVVEADADVEQTADVGASLRALLTESDDPVALLVVADGATSLSARAPGGGDEPQAHVLQNSVDAALGGADCAALSALSAADCDRWGVSGRAVWQAVAAALSGNSMQARLHYAAAPLGVGYTVATWTATE